MKTADERRLQTMRDSPELEPETFSDAITSIDAEAAGPRGDLRAGAPPANACEAIRQLMATKLQEWNRYRTLVFIVLGVAAVVLMIAIGLTVVDTTRAAGIATGVTNIVVNGGLVALLIKERNQTGRLADKYVAEYKKYKCT